MFAIRDIIKVKPAMVILISGLFAPLRIEQRKRNNAKNRNAKLSGDTKIIASEYFSENKKRIISFEYADNKIVAGTNNNNE